MRRQLASLVESAAQSTPRVQRHRDDTVRVTEEICTGCPHDGGKRTRKRASPVILERVQDVAERAVIVSGRPAGAQKSGAAPAARALLEGHADDPP
jgi:hypothetical protein